jgi:ATP-dependent Clp protease ATP-binding subunit ClpC
VWALLEGALKKVFRPEFLNRIDDVIFFRPLEKNHLLQIVDLALNKVLKRLNGAGYHVEITDMVKEFLCDKGFDPQNGARPLNRAIQRYIEDPIADEMLNLEGEKGIRVDLNPETKEIVISPAPAPTAA